jgi:MYXO-CTERM domain-containing protein
VEQVQIDSFVEVRKMKRVLFTVAALSICAAPVLADPISELSVSPQNTWFVGSQPLGIPDGGTVRTPNDPSDRYSNIGTFTANIANQQPVVATSAGNSITRALMDDIHAISSVSLVLGDTGPGGSVIVNMGNANTVAVSARMRVRFWDANGAGGAPGTYHGGFSSANNLNCNANTACLFRFAGFTTAFNLFNLPQDFWVGISYDNGGVLPNPSGVATATVAQLGNIGMATWDPPEIGTSQDRDFFTSFNDTTGNGYLGVNNPAGAIRTSPFGGNPKGNYGMSFGPEPGTIALLALGALPLIRRRRRS